MQDKALAIENLTVGYTVRRKRVEVVSRINATLRRGEFVALIGRNGAGKSTLLRTLTATQPPLDGEVKFGGTALCELGTAELARHISVVLTGNAATNLTVRELVALGRIPYTNFLGHLTTADNKVVNSAMELMGVAAFAGRDIASLSDGERQKCFIAKALAQETPVLFLDEPTAFLDYPSKVRLFATLRKLARENGKAVVVSTHDIDIVQQAADTVWLIDGGTMYPIPACELPSNRIFRSFMDSGELQHGEKE